MNKWNTKVHFLTLYNTYFKILLKTINKYIWKNLKITQEQSLDIVVFCPPQIRKIQAPCKKLDHWKFCIRFILSAVCVVCYDVLYSFDARMKDRWRRRYEGRKKGSHLYSGEACMKPERSQCACEAHLRKQFRKPTLYDHKYLQNWQINLTKV